jgi:Cu(I)/Ag(I) efflux system membrane fusion protein/cobalt-zinc-cadmium efflux system membrane fusion protein
MKRIMIKSIWTLSIACAVVAAGAVLLSGIHDNPSETAIAAVSDLKAGMVDPKNGKTIKYWVAPMDPTYIRNEPGKSPMGMDLVPKYEEDGSSEPVSTIRVDPTTVQNMGVRLAVVERKPMSKTIRAFGNITYDERRLYAVNTKFDGWIEKLDINYVGQRVTKGDPLFKIYSPDLVTAQEEYLLALRQYRKVSGNSNPRIKDNAERLRAAARTRLRYWDISEAQIQRIENTGKVTKTITVYCPATGIVLKKNAYLGHLVKAGQHQFEIADLSNVWVDVEVYEYELPWVRNGMEASMELSYVPGKKFKGRVLYIYPYLSEKTRTARLRLEFDNDNFELKPDMYANIYLKTALDEQSLVIPQEAVIDSGIRKVAFVSKGEGRFEPRQIELGMEVNGNDYQVLSGLSEGERVVTSAQFMLDSESRLREAIQKMLEVRSEESAANDTENLDMDALSMDGVDDEDMDMTDLTMTSEDNPDAVRHDDM